MSYFKASTLKNTLTIAIIFMLAGCIKTQPTQQPLFMNGEAPLPNQLGSLRHIQLHEAPQNIEIYSAKLSARYKAQIYQQSATTHKTSSSIGDLSKTEPFVLAINGGFYSPTFQPVGLFVLNGQKIGSVNKDDPLMGTCVYIKHDKLHLKTERNACNNKQNAMQTGPVLIEGGKVSHQVNELQAALPKLRLFFVPRRRTILAESGKGELLVIISSKATLQQMTSALKDHPELFGVKSIHTAIDLDGGFSTGMYVRFPGQPFYSQEGKNVKTFLFFS